MDSTLRHYWPVLRGILTLLFVLVLTLSALLLLLSDPSTSGETIRYAISYLFSALSLVFSELTSRNLDLAAKFINNSAQARSRTCSAGSLAGANVIDGDVIRRYQDSLIQSLVPRR